MKSLRSITLEELSAQLEKAVQHLVGVKQDGKIFHFEVADALIPILYPLGMTYHTWEIRLNRDNYEDATLILKLDLERKDNKRTNNGWGSKLIWRNLSFKFTSAIAVRPNASIAEALDTRSLIESERYVKSLQEDFWSLQVKMQDVTNTMSHENDNIETLKARLKQYQNTAAQA